MKMPILCILLLTFAGFSHGNVVAPRRKHLIAIYFLSYHQKKKKPVISLREIREHFLIRDFNFLKVCGGRVFVEDSVVIEVSTAHENCQWDTQTQEDRILVFTVLNGNLKEAQDFLAV